MLLGVSALSLFMLLLLGCSGTQMVQVNTDLAGREQDWTFVGRSTWAEKEGVIYSPLYSNPKFDRGAGVPSVMSRMICRYDRLCFSC